MNWKEIEKNYDKAFSHACKWFVKTPDALGLRLMIGFNMVPNRDLYDFFDENGIIIECSVSYDYDDVFTEQVKSIYEWSYDIITIGIETIWESHRFKTRKEAEQEAFGKAFEILEQKLNQ